MIYQDLKGLFIESKIGLNLFIDFDVARMKIEIKFRMKSVPMKMILRMLPVIYSMD
jgi:hypothetical protein